MTNEHLSGALTLRCGVWTADILPMAGANVVRLRRGDDAVLREPPGLAALSNEACLWGEPMLFPANRTAGGRFCFAGWEYRLPINEPIHNNHLHGALHDAPFTVLFADETHVVCRYVNTGEIYPFPFSMTVESELCDTGLRRRFTLTNLGREAMPYTFALHTTFAVDAADDFAVPVARLLVRDAHHCATGETLPLGEFSSYVTGAPAAGQAVSGYFTAAGRVARVGRWRYAVEGDFDVWTLFNGGGMRGYFCAEPQCGLANGLNLPGGCRVLPSGQCVCFTTEISVWTN